MQLYKYFSGKGALRLFRTGVLRFTQPAEFNDPFEMQPFLKGLADESTLETQFNAEFGKSLGPQIEDMLGKLAPEQRASIDRGTIDQLVLAQAPEALAAFKGLADIFTPVISREIYKRVNENLGVLCLTEEPINLLMWAHYADQHRGAVVEFDSAHSFFSRRCGPQDDLRHFRKVAYTQQRPQVFLNDSDAIDFFYFKSKEWEYEQEWRLILPLNDCTQRVDRALESPICLYEVPPECIRTVSVGVRMPEPQKLELTRELRSNACFRHIRVEQIALDPQMFGLQRHEVPPEVLDQWINKTPVPH